MKVVGFNGSPNKKGNTACSLNMVFEALENAGIETEMIHVGKKKIQGCTACLGCVKKQNETCTLDDDPVNEWIQRRVVVYGCPVFIELDRRLFNIFQKNNLSQSEIQAYYQSFSFNFSTLTSISLLSSSMSAFSLGKNSCSGGSSSLTVTGFPL